MVRSGIGEISGAVSRFMGCCEVSCSHSAKEYFSFLEKGRGLHNSSISSAFFLSSERDLSIFGSLDAKRAGSKIWSASLAVLGQGSSPDVGINDFSSLNSETTSSEMVSVSFRGADFPLMESAMTFCKKSLEVIRSNRISLSAVYAAVTFEALLYLKLFKFLRPFRCMALAA